MTFRWTSKHIENRLQTGKQIEKRKDTQTGKTDRKSDRLVEKDFCCQMVKNSQTLRHAGK